MYRSILAITAAAALLAVGPASAVAQQQKASPGGAVSKDTTGGQTPAPRPDQSSLSDQQIQNYVQVRRQLEQSNTELRQAFRSGDLSKQEKKLQAGWKDNRMTFEEFMKVHQQVQATPELKKQVQTQLAGAGSATGASQSGASTSGAAKPGASPGGAAASSSPAGTTSGAASGAQPGSSPK
jgi:hypothetical protein